MTKFLGIGLTDANDNGYLLEQTQRIREVLAGPCQGQANPALRREQFTAR